MIFRNAFNYLGCNDVIKFRANVRKKSVLQLPKLADVCSEKLFTSAISLKADIKSTSSGEIPKNLLEEHITAHKQPTLGRVYDKKPFKILLEAKKTYSWCTCGWSKNQPFCDGTHKNPYVRITLRPVRFQVEEKKEYWLCNCKQTGHRPFCDGAHKALQDTAAEPAKT